MSVRTKWLIVLSIMALFYWVLLTLYPIIGGSVNLLSFGAPVVATLFFGFRIGAIVVTINWIITISIFSHISHLTIAEGLIRAPIPFLVTLAICFGTDRLQLYLAQRKQAEKLQQVTEERYRLIFQHSADGILLLDETGVVQDASPAVQSHIGIDPQFLKGKKLSQTGIFAQDASAEIEGVLKGKNDTETTELEVSGRNHQRNRIFLQLTFTSIAERKMPFRWICLVKNTTERREMQARLHEAQKMKAIGRLAGGVAHDLNNILNAIIGSTHAHRHEVSRFQEHFEDLDNITSACNRGAQLT